MKRSFAKGNHLVAVLTLAATLAFSFTLSAVTFDFSFDTTAKTPGVQPPLDGTGFMTINTDPGDGTFTLASLGVFSLGFSFQNGDTFSAANIQSVLTRSEVVISGVAGSRRLQFTDTGGGAGGPLNGSLDLLNGTKQLSFEPSFIGGGLQLYFEPGIGPLPTGDYFATEDDSAAAPDGASTLCLLGLGGLGLAALSTRRRLA